MPDAFTEDVTGTFAVSSFENPGFNVSNRITPRRRLMRSPRRKSQRTLIVAMELTFLEPGLFLYSHAYIVA